MPNRKVLKLSVPVSRCPKSVSAQAEPAGSNPPVEVIGVYRYTLIFANVYSVYVETIKKYRGLVKREGGLYANITVEEAACLLKQAKVKIH